MSSAMRKHRSNDPFEARECKLSKRARLQALLFTAGSIGTTLLTLGMLADTKLPKNQAE